MYIITKDRRPRTSRLNTYADVLAAFHRLVPYSMEHACQHEGWAVLEVPDDTWHETEARELRATAINLFSDHGHEPTTDTVVLDSCGACALRGHGEHADSGTLAPNYAGWERTYVQAGEPIPARWVAAFLAELGDGDNARYADCLRLDIRAFGLRGGAVQFVPQALIEPRTARP